MEKRIDASKTTSRELLAVIALLEYAVLTGELDPSDDPTCLAVVQSLQDVRNHILRSGGTNDHGKGIHLGQRLLGNKQLVDLLMTVANNLLRHWDYLR